MARWEIDGSELVLVDGTGSVRRVTSSFVYNAMGVGSGLVQDAPDPRDDLPDLRFSKRGLSISFSASFHDGKFSLLPKASKLGKSVPLGKLPIPLPDHVVAGGVWYFINDDVALLNEILADVGVSSFGPISLVQYLQLVTMDHAGECVSINDDLVDIAKRSSSFSDSTVPPLLNAKLYPYQLTGYGWLRFMAEQADGCVLGDEMGLGKTLQVIALLLARHDEGRQTSLVIAPVSLLENWRREFARFAPTLDVFTHHGSDRPGWVKTLEAHDVVVMSYGTAISDLGMLAMGNWDVLVLDEAQAIKNPDSRRSISIKRIPRAFGIAVSGTPFENHVLDVWSLFNFVEPPLLGDRDGFTAEYPDNLEGAAKLEGNISPFILRRTVSEVADDLPKKTVINVPLTPLDSEAEAYEEIRRLVVEEVGEAGATLASLTRLRMFCTHPIVLDDSLGVTEKALPADPSSVSSKYSYLCMLLEEIFLRGEKVLIFTSYRKMFALLSHDLPSRFGVSVFEIDGSTEPKLRQSVVDEFSAQEQPSVLVLNPTAAGTGLNVTAACNVIHYNLEWNPAKEDQATARAYRRGQERPVMVYRLFYAGTVEESIKERMDLKREMAGKAIVGTDGDRADREAIIRALSLSPIRSQGQ